MNEMMPIERIESKIYMIRGQKVMLDRDLADFYGVKTFVLNQAVKRNIYRFPADFMFILNEEEARNLKSQIVMSSWGGRRSLPHVFTEQGVAMLSSILQSRRAIEINIAIIRSFIHLRQILSTHKELLKKITQLEKGYSKHEIEISTVFKLLRQLMEPVRTEAIGFHLPNK